MATSNPLQLVKEAKQIARDHGMRVAECLTASGIDYVVYRRLQYGRDVRIGKRSSPEAIRRFVRACARVE